MEEAGIRAYVSVTDSEKVRPYYATSRFVYGAEGDDLYRCPQGEPLRLYTHSYTEKLTRYRADPEASNACPLKPQCTPGDTGRVVRRSFYEEILERVRAYRGTFPYEKALRKRGVWVEPLFGEAKEWHGMRRFRLRRLERVNSEALMIASGQNLKRLLALGPRVPRKTAMAAALRPPEKPPPRPLRRHRAIPARRFSTGCPLRRSWVHRTRSCLS